MDLDPDRSSLRFLAVGTDALQADAVQGRPAARDVPTERLTATTVAEAEEIARGAHLTAIVARQDLPDGDGLSFLSRCRERRPELLTILVADGASRSLVDRAYEAGIDEVVGAASSGTGRVVEHHLSAYLGDGESSAGGPRTTRHMETLAAATSDAIVSIDESSVVRYANPAVADVFGYEPGEVVGKPLTMLMSDELADRHHEGIGEYLRTGDRTLDWHDIELPGQHREGHEVPLSISFSEFSVGSDRYFTGIIRDITDRKRLRAERELYHEATQRILGATSFEDGLGTAIEAVGAAMDWRYGEAWVRPDERLERTAETYVDSAAAETFERETATASFDPDEGLVGRVWASGVSEWIPDVTAADAGFERADAAATAGLGAALGVPIVSGDEVVAVMTFFLGDARDLDEAMIEATEKIAADLGRLMERLRAETALREERALKDRVLETSPVGIVILAADGSVEYCNDHAGEILGVEAVDGSLSRADLDIEPLAFDGDPDPDGKRPSRRVIEDGEAVSGEARVDVDGEERWLSVNGAPMRDGDEVTSAVFALEDVTDRRARERRLRQYEQVMETVSDGVYALDEAGRFVLVNEAYAELTGYDREELLGRPADEFIDARLTDGARELTEQLGEEGLREATLEGVITTASGEQVPIEVHVSLFELGEGEYGRVGVVRDVSERKRREERLARLNEVGQALTTAETVDAVADIVVEGARETLERPLVTLEYYDEESGQLRPGPRTRELEALAGDEPLFGSEWGLPWQVYTEHDARVVSDVEAATDLDGEETPFESAVVLPVGDHGVFVAGATEPDAFSDTDVMVARVLVANAVAALDRVERERELRESKARLEEHNESLERINRLNSVIRNLTRELVQASTREEIETAVCEQLAAVDPYAFAWLGERRATGDEVTARASAGRGEGYLDAVTITAGDDADGHNPTVAALRTREPAVNNNLQVDPPFEPWRTQAVRRGYRSGVAVPVTFRETVYGVLTVYADETGVFDEVERAVLGELGDMIGYAINAIERKRALVSDGAVELSFRVDDPSIPAVRFAEETGSEFVFDQLVERSDGSFRVFFTVAGSDPDEVYEFAEGTPTVHSVSLITDGDDGCRFEAVVSGSGFLGDLVSYGAHPTEMTAGPDGGEVTVEFPQSGDVQAFVRMFLDEYDGAQLVARTELDRPVRTRAEFEANYRDRLTERQTEVLKTAYFSGFFEWPRDTSTEELAAMLDVSQPTVSRHVRTGERKLFELVFDDQ